MQEPPGAPHAAGAGTVDEAMVAEVREVVTSLVKAVRARQTYVPENPLVEKFRRELADKLALLWGDLPHLTLTVDEGRFLWSAEEVYTKEVGPENVAFRFFKDGIRSLAFLPGVESEELTGFLDILARTGWAQGDDLVALLWHQDFSTIRMEYADVGEDETLEVPQPDRTAGAGEQVEDMSEIEEVLSSGPLMTDMADEAAEFSDVALGEADLAYLRREMEGEWARPLVHDVTLALLDQFETRDEDRRRQVVDVLREFLPRLLAAKDFPNVALIVNELQLLANKTGELETQELVASLLSDMSEAMAALLSSAERGAEEPAEDEMSALLQALQAEAIPTLVRAMPAVPSPQVRRQLAEALDRLVSAHPQRMTDLLRAEDPVLAAEAARIVGRLGVTEAEPALVELAGRPEQVARQAAIEALAALGSLAGVEALGAALSDPDREVRLAAVHAVAELKPPGLESMLRKWIGGNELAARDQSEQMAFFKAYAAVAESAAVPTLGKLLNGRRWWGGRRPVSLRAGAARALGIIGGPEARKVLQKAAKDKAAPVKSAVRVALRAAEREAPDQETPDAFVEDEEP